MMVDSMRKIKYGKNNNGKISECAGLWSWMNPSDIDTIERSIEKRRKLSNLAKKEKARAIK